MGSDSWGGRQSELELGAEDLAQVEMLRAGKLSGLFGGSPDGSETPKVPKVPKVSVPRNLTPSLISIVTCDSDEDRANGNDHYEMVITDTSDDEDLETLKQDNTPRRIGEYICLD